MSDCPFVKGLKVVKSASPPTRWRAAPVGRCSSTCRSTEECRCRRLVRSGRSTSGCCVPEVLPGRLRGPGNRDRGDGREQAAARVAPVDSAASRGRPGLLHRLAAARTRLPGLCRRRHHDERGHARPASLAAPAHDSGLPGRADRQPAAPPARARRPADPGVPALHDPATGYPWAVSVARQLGRSGALLTYEGHGHGSVTSGPCMEGAVDSYPGGGEGHVTRSSLHLG
ncbi:alpha/beta hydrolase [Streptomyces griseorubiginosus]|uniref:alpha/beta hydrolase n=1 Tax=Streptomyces griseorubiginosus TaxID=67304 RepID=UPI0036E2F14D